MIHGTVLIVEDEPEVAEVLAYNLGAARLEVRTAADGLTACRRVGERPPDLILLDVLLPDLLGWEICRMIRSHKDPAVAGVPIIMLTALADTGDRLRGLELGADDYLPKPFSVREVVLRVGNLIAKSRALEAADRRLRDLERHRDADRDLQNLLSHELKNKLMVIGGFSKRLAAQDGQPEPHRRYAETIHRASRYLETLAEQVLLLRRVEDGSLALPVEDFDLEQVIRDAVELHQGSAAEKGIRLRLEAPAPDRTVRGSALALRVGLSNLVENAIRYSPAGTTVAVRSGWDDGNLYLEVDDEGPGVPKAERDRVFERFYRGTSARGAAGTGLGLYVVRTLVQAMGGRATLADRPRGPGARARIEVPQPGS